MTKAVEFGLIHETTRAGDSVRHAILAEKLGFSSYWVPEDYAFPGAFSICSAIACQTERIKIGIGVLNPYTRHPVLTAMEFAALDQLSQGRGILGIGAGVKLWIEDQLGIPYTRPGHRDARDDLNQPRYVPWRGTDACRASLPRFRLAVQRRACTSGDTNPPWRHGTTQLGVGRRGG